MKCLTSYERTGDASRFVECIPFLAEGLFAQQILQIDKILEEKNPAYVLIFTIRPKRVCLCNQK
jgi:hypothetical protein